MNTLQFVLLDLKSLVLVKLFGHTLFPLLTFVFVVLLLLFEDFLLRSELADILVEFVDICLQLVLLLLKHISLALLVLIRALQGVDLYHVLLVLLL